MFKKSSIRKHRIISAFIVVMMVLSVLHLGGLRVAAEDTKEAVAGDEAEHTHTAGTAVKENETAVSYEEVVYRTECKQETSRNTVYTKYTIVGWENDGPDGAIAGVKVDGVELPQTGATLTADPDVEINVEITFNDGFTYDPDKGIETFLRIGGVQSEQTNITSSSYPSTKLTIPSSDWLNGTYGEDNTDQEIYIIIPTKEKEYYSITVDTGGKCDVSLSNLGKEHSDMVKLGDNNTILIDKDMWDEYNWSIGGAVDFVNIPEVEGFHQGDISERSGLVIDDPETLTDWESYDKSRDAIGKKLTESVDENGCITVYVKWFEILDSMSIKAEAPKCGQEIGETDTPVVQIPAGEVWEFAGSYSDLQWINLVEEYGSWYYPWIVIEGNTGMYDSQFIGTVEGGNPYYIEMHFCAPFGYYYDPEITQSDISVTYTDLNGAECAGVVRNTMIMRSTSEMDYNIVMFEVEAQHVPGDPVIENKTEPSCLETGSHDEAVYCTCCETELSRETITDPALGHLWGDWVVTKEPAIGVEGERQRKCQRCGLVEKEAIPALIGCTVKFDANGHGTAPDSQLILQGKTAEKPADLTAEGYTFEGWFTDAKGTAEFDFGTAITEDITVYAKWSENISYTVTFDANGHGTAPEAQTVAEGEKAVKPEELTAEGYTFEGWYADAEGTAEFDFGTAITKDTTVYAKWSEKEEEIIYTIVEGSDSTWTKGSSDKVRIVVKRNIDDDTCFSHYTGFLLDGNALSVNAYAGSTVIEIAPETLEKVSEGAHNVTVTFDDGKAETKLTILKASITPRTGDPSDMTVWLLLMIAAAAVFGIALIRRNGIRK